MGGSKGEGKREECVPRMLPLILYQQPRTGNSEIYTAVPGKSKFGCSNLAYFDFSHDTQGMMSGTAYTTRFKRPPPPPPDITTVGVGSQCGLSM